MTTRSKTPLAKTDSRQRAGGDIATSCISIEQVRSITTIGKSNKSNTSVPHLQRIVTWEKRGGSSALKSIIEPHADGVTTSWQGSDRAEVMPVNRVSNRFRGNNNKHYSGIIQSNNPTINLQSAKPKSYKLISNFKPEFLTE